MDIIFPNGAGVDNWFPQLTYLLNLFLYGGAKIQLEKRDGPIITIDKVLTKFDVLDQTKLQQIDIKNTKYITYKLHTIEKFLSNIIPFAPISFHDWAEKELIDTRIKYFPSNHKKISMRQLESKYLNNSGSCIRVAATNRRKKIQSLLIKNFGDRVATERLSQREYFLDVSNVQTSVCVPGFCNNMLDRGQFQYMAFGVCTISPNLPEILPFNTKIIPGKHYIKCSDDYSDLINIINSLNTETCLEIGKNAKSLFDKTSSPKAIMEWIKNK